MKPKANKYIYILPAKPIEKSFPQTHLEVQRERETEIPSNPKRISNQFSKNEKKNINRKRSKNKNRDSQRSLSARLFFPSLSTSDIYLLFTE